MKKNYFLLLFTGCILFTGILKSQCTVTVTANAYSICPGYSSTLSVAGVSGTQYTWSPGGSGASSIVVTPTATSVYTVHAKKGSCTNNQTITITVLQQPTISANSGAICIGQSFTIVPSGANTYTFSGGSSVVSPTATSSYSVTGTSSAGCISALPAIAHVTVNPLPTISVNSGTICSGNSFTISASGANTYTFSGGSSVVSPSTTTSYSVMGTSLLGCNSASPAISIVNVNASPTISVNSGAICSGQSFTLSPSGANTYTFSGGTAIVSPTVTTSYSVTGTAANGCISLSPAISTVIVNPLPVISVNSGAICTGDSFTMVPSGANTYTFSGGSSVVSPTATASYYVTGTSVDGCVSASPAISTVTVNPLPVISVNSGAICSGDSFTMVPSGANTYTFSGGSAVVSPTATTSYSVTGTSVDGCVSASPAISTVTVNPLPVISVNSGAICSGDSFTMVPSGANTYTFSGGSAVVSPTATTSYSVTGTSVDGCVSASPAISTVTVNPLPVISVNSGAICSGDSFTIVPSGANTYTFSGGSSVVSPTATTSYYVTGTSVDGCVSASPAISTVTVNPLPVISVNSGAICSGDSFTIVPSGANTYTFSGGSSVVSPTATTSYYVTGTSVDGCVSASPAISTVTVNPLPVISVNSGAICTGDSFTMVPSGAITYTFSGGSSVVSPTATISYSVTGTSVDGCVSSSPGVSTVTVNPLPVISVNSGAICSGGSFTLVPSGANTYTFSGGSSVVSPTATISYSVTGTSVDGCVSSSPGVSTVTVNPLPVISVYSGSICPGDSFTMVPSGANTYTFSGGSAVVSPTVTTSYSVTGTSVDGCVSASSAVSTVTVNALPVISVNSGSICPGDSFTIVPSGANTYTFSGGSAVVSPTVTTSYSVTGTSIDGCVSAAAAIANVTVNPTFTVTIGPNPTVYYGYGPAQCVTLTATVTGAPGPFQYTWSPGGATTSSIVVCPTVTTTYSLNVSYNGCMDPPQVTVNVINTSCHDDKVIVCHNNHTICIAQAAVPAHLTHGDNLGQCNIIAPIVHPAGLAEDKINEINIYPNPNEGSFTIVAGKYEANNFVKIEMINLVGQVIYSANHLLDNAGNVHVEIDRALPAGVYFVKLQSDNRQCISRMILEK